MKSFAKARHEQASSLKAHAGDPRVGETSSFNDFLKLRLGQRFQAVVYHLGDIDKQYARKVFASINKAGDKQFSATVTGRGVIKYEISHDFDKSVQAQLSLMMATYARITGFQNVRSLVIHDLQAVSMHTHKIPTLNVSYLLHPQDNVIPPLGTIWENAKGDIWQVNEGDWFFFDAGFRHASPLIQDRRGQRVTVVVMKGNEPA